MSEERKSQESPITEDVPRDAEEKSTAESPPKTNPEETHQDPPRVKMMNPAQEGEKADDNAVVEPDLAAKNQADQPPNGGEQQQDHNVDMGQYFESSNEEDVSAKPGGSSIDPQSSTSKISAAAGILESFVQGLDVSTPEEALEKLLSGGNLNTNSEGISAPSRNDMEAQLKQELWEAKFKEEFLQRDVLDVIDEDPQAYFSLKASLRQLQNDRTSEALLFLVNQAEVHIDQFAKNQQLLVTAHKSYQVQIQAHASVLVDATQCNVEVGNMKSGVTAAYLQAVACEDNIAKWKAEIGELEAKIAEEERLQKH
jgi:hypothetical protein